MEEDWGLLGVRRGRTFIGNVIFVCLQLPPRSFVSAGLRLRRRASVVESRKDCSSERLHFITNGNAFIADWPGAAWKYGSRPGERSRGCETHQINCSLGKKKKKSVIIVCLQKAARNTEAVAAATRITGGLCLCAGHKHADISTCLFRCLCPGEDPSVVLPTL